MTSTGADASCAMRVAVKATADDRKMRAAEIEESLVDSPVGVCDAGGPMKQIG